MTLCDDMYESIDGADAVVLLTEWDAFKHLDLERVRSLMRGRHFFDLRNQYSREALEALGFIYEGVGR